MDQVAFYLAQANAFQLRAKHTRNPALAAQHREMAERMMDAAQRAAEPPPPGGSQRP